MLARNNLGAATRVRPLSVTAALDLSAGVADDGVVYRSAGTFAGHTSPGISIGADAGSGRTTTTANSQGAFRLAVPLSEGANTVGITVTDNFGQRSDLTFKVTRRLDDKPPTVTTHGLTSGQSVPANVTITGQAIDPGSGVATVQGRVDSGAWAGLTLDGSGRFQLTTDLAHDGSADGPHTIQFLATDNAGNSSVTALPFTLDTPGVNRAITTDPGVQQNPSVAVDPLDPNHLAVAYMDRSLVTTGYAGIGVAVSRDNGVTWSRSAVPLPAGFDQGAATPTVRFDDQGHTFVIYEAATFKGGLPPLTNPTTRDPVTQIRDRTRGFQSNNGIFVVRSGDGGLTWGLPVAVASNLYAATPVPFEINAEVNIDLYKTLPNGQANPFYGDMYATWSRYYPAGQFPGEPDSTGGSDIFISVSHDAGKTWQIQLMANPATGGSISVLQKKTQTGRGAPAAAGFMNDAHLAIGPEGDLYVNSILGGSVGVHFSTDGGKSFATPDDEDTGQRVAYGFPQNFPVSLTLPTNAFQTIPQRTVAADATRPGVVYVAEEGAGFDAAGNMIDAADIYFARSNDYGVTFQTHVKIGSLPAQVLNDDNAGQIDTGQPGQVISGQALVKLASDSAGDLVAIWLDTRRDPLNHLLDVYGTISRNGGQSFSPNFRITTSSFDADKGKFTDPTGRLDSYLGDFLGLFVANGSAYAAWTDTRADNQDIEFARFPIDPAPAPLNDQFEPNGSATTATNLGPVIHTTLPRLAIPQGDQDWFQFRATATGVLIAQATAGQPGDAPMLDLVDSNGSTVLATGVDQLDAQGRRVAQRIEFAGVAGRTYLLHVRPSGDSGDASYSLDVKSFTVDLGTRVQADVGGELAAGDQAYDLIRAGVSGSMEVSLAAGEGFRGALQFEVLDPDTLAVLATGTNQASVVVTQGQSLIVHVFGTPTSLGHYLLDFTNLDQYETHDNSNLLFPAGAGPSEVALGDLNGDGAIDAVVTNGLSNTISVLLGNGDGTFQAPRQFAVGSFVSGGPITGIGLPNFGRPVVIADLNRDKVPDIVVGNPDSGDISVLLGRGDGTFDPQRRFDAFLLNSIAVGDVNNDGFLDIVATGGRSARTSNQVLAVLLGRGDGTFQHQISGLPTGEVLDFGGAIALADVNRDGKLDLIKSSYNPRETSILTGLGDGTFRQSASISGMQDNTLVLADLDGDHILDAIGADFDTDRVKYALGKADGTFGPAISIFGGESPLSVAVADMGSQVTLDDGSTVLGPPDGVPDLIVAATGAPKLVRPARPRLRSSPAC